jgi:hypothetical protein
MTWTRFVSRWAAIFCAAFVALVLIDWGNPSGWRMAIAAGPVLLSAIAFTSSLKRQRQRTTDLGESG